jgi:hypothetical protein
LRPRDPRGRRQSGSARGAMQEFATFTFYKASRRVSNGSRLCENARAWSPDC